MAASNSPRQIIGMLIFLLWGPLCWALQLTLTYGSQSALCAFDVGEHADGHDPLVTGAALAVIAMAMLAAGLLLIAPAWLSSRLAGAPAPAALEPFLSGVARALAGLSIMAMIFNGLAVTILPACAQLR